MSSSLALTPVERVLAGGVDDGADVPGVQLGVAVCQPLRRVGGDEGQVAGQVGEVLAGVVDVGDVGGVGVKGPGHGPDPRGAVAEGDDLAEVLAAAAQVLGFHQLGEGVLAGEGGHVGGGAGVHHRPAVVIQARHGEQPGELDLAGPGPAVAVFAWPALGLAGAHGHAGPVDLDIEHVGDRLAGAAA